MVETEMAKHESPIQKATARSRRERKQSKFQRHKAGMSPQSATSPSQNPGHGVSFSESSHLSRSLDYQDLDESIDMPDDEKAFMKALASMDASVDESMDAPDDEKASEQKIIRRANTSEGSATNNAFDMRSVHEYPPPAPKPDETTANITSDGETFAFTPMDEDFDMHLTETQEEEKKEKESDESDQHDMDPSWNPDHFSRLIQQGVNVGEQTADDKPQDTSWDASAAAFSENAQPENNETPKKGGFDMFDTGSWGNTDVTFNDIGGEFLRLLQQSLNPLDSQFTSEQKDVLEDVQRNLELAGSIDRADTKIDTAATPKTGHISDKNSKPVNDDEPLLVGILASCNESTLKEMEERVKMYNAPNEPDEESLDGEDVDEEGSEDDDSSEEDSSDEEIGYISQQSESDDEEEPNQKSPQITSKDPAPLFDHKEAPSLDIAAMEAGQSTLQPPLMPPPPCEEKEEYQGKSAGKSASIPLIAPPPAEKVKKWEDEKTRGQRHLAAVKAKQKNEVTDIEGPPEVMRTTEPSLFGSPTKKSPSEKARSPSSMDDISDKKMAEKMTLASSVAAVTFEECLGSSASSPKPGRSSAASGAFTNWIDAEYSPKRNPREQKDQQNNLKSYVHERQGGVLDIQPLSESELLAWLSREVLGNKEVSTEQQANVPLVIQLLLEDDTNFNVMCKYMADSVNNATSEIGIGASFEELTLTSATTQEESHGSTGMDSTINRNVKEYLERKRPWLKPMVLSNSNESQKVAPGLLAANFVSFLYLTSKISKVPSPFGSSNPFLAQIVSIAMDKTEKANTSGNTDLEGTSSPQQLVFNDPKGNAVDIMQFVYKVCKVSEFQGGNGESIVASGSTKSASKEEASKPAIPSIGNATVESFRRYIVPDEHPSPFETAVWTAPRIVPAVLSFLGDPVAVCRVKMVNRFCQRIVSENEHMIMQDAVRVGGLNMNVRPAFWMWITLQKCTPEQASKGREIFNINDLKELHLQGVEGKWNHVIERDVARSFGNMPPHKTGARLRTDSIVRALVTWGQNRIMKRGVKGGGEETPLPELGPYRSRKQKEKPRRNTFASPPWVCSGDTTSVASENSETPTDTVSDWGGVSPVASMVDSVNEADTSTGKQTVLPKEELALSGTFLTTEMKSDLQSKLSFILNSLAAAHGDVGYCQGMDYVVAHLLRILQDTVRWKAVQGTLPQTITAAASLPDFSGLKQESLPKIVETVDNSLVIEETVFRVMDIFFTNFNLRHMYWPELRCLKTCCRVFEKLIKIKLPVLADHFEHHDLNVGLFALGWFQTLFLYLPSMPSATVCHMWDIWLVERSFKIFFRVGTAILFLSQPILLNHELEGMMTYLNTIPDATLLKPDILIACALNIKVTNKMLQELEDEVTSTDN